MSDIETSTQTFIAWAQDEIDSREEIDIDIPISFPEKRIRKRKKMAGELAEDDPIKDSRKNYEVETHNRILDKIINSIECRFKNNGELYKDIALLSPTNFDEVKQGVPSNSFKKLCELLENY
jgi:hypothetical protein